MAQARLKLVSDNTDYEQDKQVAVTDKVTKPKRTQKAKLPVEEPAQDAPNQAATKKTTRKPRTKKAPENAAPVETQPVEAKAPEPAVSPASVDAKPTEVAQTTQDKPLEAVAEKPVTPASATPAVAGKTEGTVVLKEEEKIVKGPVIPANVLSAIIAYKTIYALSTLNSKTKKLTATHYAVCLVSGRNPTWAVFTIHGKLQRLRDSMEQVQRDYPRLTVRKIMSEFRLNNVQGLAVEKRRSAIELLLSSK